MNRKQKVEKDSISVLAVIAIVLFSLMLLGTVLNS
jgi:hypothetical protein